MTLLCLRAHNADLMLYLCLHFFLITIKYFSFIINIHLLVLELLFGLTNLPPFFLYLGFLFFLYLQQLFVTFLFLLLHALQSLIDCSNLLGDIFLGLADLSLILRHEPSLVLNLLRPFFYFFSLLIDLNDLLLHPLLLFLEVLLQLQFLHLHFLFDKQFDILFR